MTRGSVASRRESKSAGDGSIKGAEVARGIPHGAWCQCVRCRSERGAKAARKAKTTRRMGPPQ